MASTAIPQPILLHTFDETCILHKGAMCDACTLLAGLDAQIAATKAKLNEQIAARYTSLSQVNNVHDPMGHRLPVEVASSIFQHCLPDSLDPLATFDTFRFSSDSGDLEFYQTTAKLTSVNRNWRNIAHSTPGLWNSIFLDLTRCSLSEDHLAVLLTNVKTRIQRSGSLLLSIRLTAMADLIAVSYCDQLLQAFCLQAHRWRNLCISAPKEVITAISTHTVPQGSPNLACLILKSSNSSDSLKGWNLSFNTPNTPRLAPSHLLMYEIGFSMKTFDFSQMTHFNTGPIKISQIYDFLPFSPRLTTLLCQIQNINQPPVSDLPLIHSSLKTFNLATIGAPTNPLSRVTLPSLETLICRYFKNECGTLRDFLSRSRCPLKTLSIDMPCNEEDLIGLLHLAPELCTLDIHTEISDRFFRYLGETARLNEGKQEFLPHLQTLSFSPGIFNQPEFNWSFLRTLIPASPAKGCRPLCTVEVCVDSLHLEESDTLDLLELISGGLDILVYLSTDSEQENLLLNHKSLADALETLKLRSPDN